MHLYGLGAADNVLIQKMLADIAAWMIFPQQNDKALREEAADKLNSKYFKTKRKLMISAIDLGHAHKATLSDMRSLLELSDEHYDQENSHHDQLTIKTIENLRWEKRFSDHKRVSILLMELLMQNEGKASIEAVCRGLLDKPKKANKILQTLGNSKQYQNDYKKYKNVCHFILAVHFLELKQIKPFPTLEKRHEDESRLFLKYCLYFKKKLLCLSNKHSRPENLFSDKDFAPVNLENLATLTPEESAQLDFEREDLWVICRQRLKQA